MNFLQRLTIIGLAIVASVMAGLALYLIFRVSVYLVN